VVSRDPPIRPDLGRERNGHILLGQPIDLLGNRSTATAVVGVRDQHQADHLDCEPLARKVGAAQSAQTKERAHEPIWR
jgi:hypothetical protein